jgi:DNA-binding transcriptional MocR family regulator
MRDYERIADALRDDILSGRLPSGMPLPSERYLAGEFGVGIDIIRDAVMALRAEHLLVPAEGERVEVRGPAGRFFLTLQPGEQVIARLATHAEAARLDIGYSAPVVEVRQPDGTTEVYAAERTGFREADAPSGWDALPNLAPRGTHNDGGRSTGA